MLHPIYGTQPHLNPNRSNPETRAWQAALRLYGRACFRGWLGQIRSALAGRSRLLLNLAEVETNYRVVNRYSAGLQSAPINRIQGTEGRCRDFDRYFRPLKSHTRNRWLRLASARQLGLALPPVELVQVGDIYFMRDGHHHISVARALDQTEIEVEVRVWQVVKPYQVIN